jgi:hypothetical protein
MDCIILLLPKINPRHHRAFGIVPNVINYLTLLQMGNKANQRKKKPRAVKKKLATPPPYDEHTHLKGLYSLYKTWTRAGDVSKPVMEKLE